MLISSGVGEGTQAKEWQETTFVTIGQQPNSCNENSQASFTLTWKEIPTFVLYVNSDQESLKCVFIRTSHTRGQICLYYGLVDEP